jgi:hypothetical protein
LIFSCTRAAAAAEVAYRPTCGAAAARESPGARQAAAHSCCLHDCSAVRPPPPAAWLAAPSCRRVWATFGPPLATRAAIAACRQLLLQRRGMAAAAGPGEQGASSAAGPLRPPARCCPAAPAAAACPPPWRPPTAARQQGARLECAGALAGAAWGARALAPVCVGLFCCSRMREAVQRSLTARGWRCPPASPWAAALGQPCACAWAALEPHKPPPPRPTLPSYSAR